MTNPIRAEGAFKTEQAWPDGPLRKVGSGQGKPSKYVCGACKRTSVGLYLVKQGVHAQRWVCQGCRQPSKPTKKAARRKAPLTKVQGTR